MNDRTDTHLTAVLTAIDDITPEPPPAPTSPSQQPARRQPLLVAAGTFVAALLIVGVGVLALRPSAIDDGEVAVTPSTQPSAASTHPAALDWVPPNVSTRVGWYETIASQAEPNGPDASILQAALGPAPNFDTSAFGVEQTLEPLMQIDNDVPWSTFYADPFTEDWGTLIVAGRVESFMFGVAPARHSLNDDQTIDALCEITLNPEGGGTWGAGFGCSDITGPIEYGMIGASLSDEVAGTDAVAFLVPPDTSVISIRSSAGVMWQRPRGGMALFVGEFANSETRFTVYTASGEALIEGTQELPPG